jgi:hypothetical protein
MEILVSIHSLFRWVVLGAALAALLVAALAWFGSATTDRQGRLATLVFVVAIDVQVLLGLLIYLLGHFWDSAVGRQIRFEHPSLMLLALAVSHLIAARARRSSGLTAARLRTVGIAVSLLIILAGILALPSSSGASNY